jgi:hypothetical protein
MRWPTAQVADNSAEPARGVLFSSRHGGRHRLSADQLREGQGTRMRASASMLTARSTLSRLFWQQAHRVLS